jgi:hypothetical protein
MGPSPLQGYSRGNYPATNFMRSKKGSFRKRQPTTREAVLRAVASSTAFETREQVLPAFRLLRVSFVSFSLADPHEVQEALA